MSIIRQAIKENTCSIEKYSGWCDNSKCFRVVFVELIAMLMNASTIQELLQLLISKM